MKRQFESLLLTASCFLTLFIVYSPVVFIPYAFHDDYYFIQTTAQRHFFDLYACHEGIRNIGRPLGAWVLTIFNWFTNTIDRLSAARFVLIITLSLCCYLYTVFLRKYPLSRLQSFLMATTIFTLPSFEAIVSYVGAGYVLYSILFGLAAAIVIDRIEGGSFDAKVNAKQICGLGLLLAAILIYPSGAMFYWVIPAHALFSSLPTGIHNQRVKFLNFFVIGILAILLYVLILAFMKPHFIQHTDSFYNPYIFTSDYVRKVGWFLKDPLVSSLNLWKIFPSRFFLVTISLIVTAHFLSMFKLFTKTTTQNERRNIIRESMLNSFVFCSLIVLSFIPNLAAVSAAGFYRCTSALTTIILIAVIYALKEWLAFLVKSPNQKFFTVILIILCLCGGYNANKNVFLYRALPSYVETSYLHSVLKSMDSHKKVELYFVFPENNQIKSRYDEFGIPTSWYQDNLPMLTLATLVELKGVAFLNPVPDVITKKVSSVKNITLGPSTRIVNMAGLYEPSGPLNYLKIKNDTSQKNKFQN